MGYFEQVGTKIGNKKYIFIVQPNIEQTEYSIYAVNERNPNDISSIKTFSKDEMMKMSQNADILLKIKNEIIEELKNKEAK